MDFNQIKNTWEQSNHHAKNDDDSNEEIKQKLKAVTSTQWKIKKYFRYEMFIAIAAILAFGIIVIFDNELELYFYKLFALIVLGSVPVNLRLFLSMKRILGINYANQLQKNLISAKNHLKTTIKIYYTIVVVTVIALLVMSIWDEYFLQLPIAWQCGVFGYLFIYLIISIYLINKIYGKRLKELERLLK